MQHSNNNTQLLLRAQIEKPSIYLGGDALHLGTTSSSSSTIEQHHHHHHHSMKVDDNNNNHHPDNELKPVWLSNVQTLLQQPQITSILWDVEFLDRVSENDWATFLVDLRHNTGLSLEYQFDVQCLHRYNANNQHLIVSRLREILDLASAKALQLQGNVRKIVFVGMTSHSGQLLAYLPTSLMELEVYFSPESSSLPGDQQQQQQLDANEQRERRSRIENMIQQYVANLPELTCCAIKYDENAEDQLPISTYALASLLRTKQLSKIEMEGCRVESDPDDDVFHDVPPDHAVFEALCSNTSLVLLRFRSGRIGTSCAETICRALEVTNRTLQYLDLGNMEIPDSVAGAAFKAAMRNQVLRGLDLNLNSLQDFGFSSLGRLVCMDLSDNFLGDEGALQLAQLIPSSRLDRFNVAENCIGPIGGCAIAWSLQHNNTITKINMCDNPLCDVDAGDGPTSDITRTIHNSFKNTPAYRQGFLGMLCASLRQNRSLSFINLANTSIEDSHGPLLAILLRVSTIDGLGLLRNHIGDKGCVYMCQALVKYPTTLRVLLLQNNSISTQGFYALWKGVLSTNDTLVSVQFGNELVEIEGVERGQRDLDIAIRMNRAGLIRLRKNKNTTRKEWVEALIQLRDNLDCSFPFLRENPLICKC